MGIVRPVGGESSIELMLAYYSQCVLPPVE